MAKHLKDSSAGLLAADGGPRYPGTCRAGLPPGKTARAWRLRVGEEDIALVDATQGAQTQQLEREVGDFVLMRLPVMGLRKRLGWFFIAYPNASHWGMVDLQACPI